MITPGQVLGLVGQHFRSRLLSGLVIVIPMVATYVVLKFVFDILDPLPQPLFDRVLGREIPGVGIVSLVILVYIAGVVGSYVLGRRLIAFGYRLVDLVPIIRPIYRTARQTIDSLSLADWENRFSRVVLLDYPRPGVKSIGFVTATYKDDSGQPMVVVYIPTTPVPTSGFLALLPEDDVVSTTLNVEEAMKIVISGGVLTPDQIHTDDRAKMDDQASARERFSR